MLNGGYTGKLVSALFITGLLTYFMIKTTSPKIIFVPFLICSASMAMKTIGQIFEKEKMISFFDMLFKAGFFLYGFGFLIFADYISIKNKQYDMLIFTLVFWAFGIFFFKRIFFNQNERNEVMPRFNIAKIAGAVLVIISFLAGVALLILGIVRAETALIFIGAFFALVSSVFILFYLSVSGFFDRFRTDVLGLYIGIVFTLIGIGVPMVKFAENFSVKETVQSFGLWILVPVIMFSAGVFQIFKTIKNRKNKD